MTGNNSESETTCGYCGKVYNPYARDRFFAGSFTVPDGTGGTKTVDALCNKHHRQFVRES